MRYGKKIYSGAVFAACALLLISVCNLFYTGSQKTLSAAAEGDFIRWVEFDVPYSALKKAMEKDIESYGKQVHIGWIDVLSCLAAQYYGEWSRYKAKDMDKIFFRLEEGDTIEQIAGSNKYFGYFKSAYEAVLHGFIGEYQTEAECGENGEKKIETKYGLKVFSPIAGGFYYSSYDDFGNSRSYGYKRRHLGHDLLGSIGTPIVAVEGGTVEHIGWNQYGGWRIGIRSFDKKRYYYYAHMRKGHPYADDFKEGDRINAGDVIGYLGMTGYSTKEDVNGMNIPHLHFGIQLIFDDSQEDGYGEIWINPYHIIRLLEQSRSYVKRGEGEKEYRRKYEIFDPEYMENLL